MQDWPHLQDDITRSVSEHLSEQLIVIGVSASIACLEVHRLARSLMRHGARVQFVLSPAAKELVSATSLAWATGRPVIESLTARCEHLELFGKHGTAGLFLVAPCTANTLGKMAHGLDDNVLTTCFTTALGSGVPVMCAPGMHEPMMCNPAVLSNLKRVKEYGVEVLEPTLAEGKQKMMGVPEMVARVMRRLGPGDLAEKRVLITGGPTREFFDPARCLTNPSSGLTACLLAEEAYRRGAEVLLVYGPGSVTPACWIPTERVTSAQDMADSCQRLLGEKEYHYLIAAAAVSDYKAAEVSPEKLATSEGDFHLALRVTPKVLDVLRDGSPGRLVAYKAASSRSDEQLKESMIPYLRAGRADVVVGNSIVEPGMGFDSTHNRYLVMDQAEDSQVLGPSPKRELVEQLWSKILCS